MALIGRQVEVRETKAEIEIFEGPRLVGTHRKAQDLGQGRATLPEHRPPRGQGGTPSAPAVEERQLLEAAPEIGSYVAALKQRAAGRGTVTALAQRLSRSRGGADRASVGGGSRRYAGNDSLCRRGDGRHLTCAAPRNAAESMGRPPSPGAHAASVVAARAATCRSEASAGSARTTGKSCRARTAPDHRRRLAQPAAAVAPTTVKGLTRLRTSGGASLVTPQSASASAMAPAE